MKHLLAALLHIRNGRPGRRFRDSHRQAREKSSREGSAWRIGQGLLGLLLVLVGIFFMAVPGPGIPILLLGLVLLATISRRAARLLDRAEVYLRLTWDAARTAWQSVSPTIRGLLVLLAIAGLVAVGYGLLRTVSI